MANFKIAEQFVSHLRLHRGRMAVNQTLLAKSFDCSPGTLGIWIRHLFEAKVINRSPHAGPDGYEYWFIDREAMMNVKWLDNLHEALKMTMAGSQRISLGKKFNLLKNQIREVEESVEQEVLALKQERDGYQERIKELEEENSSMRFEMNAMLQKMRELEMAYKSMVVTINSKEQKAAAEAVAAEAE